MFKRQLIYAEPVITGCTPTGHDLGRQNLAKLANPNESALSVSADPEVEKPAGAAELMIPDEAPGPEDN